MVALRVVERGVRVTAGRQPTGHRVGGRPPGAGQALAGATGPRDGGALSWPTLTYKKTRL